MLSSIILQVGEDGISSEIHNEITPVLNGILIYVYKGKRPKAECGNFRGIILLTHMGNIISKMVLDRQNENVFPHVLPEELCGLRPERWTTGLIGDQCL